jgi:amphi-Trp domain-containing protein
MAKPSKVQKKLARQERQERKRALKAERRKHRRKAQAVLSRAEIADQLRALASQVEGGIFVLGDKELELPPHADFEISYKLTKRGGQQIEVEIEWGKGKTATLLPTDQGPAASLE